MNEKLIGSAMDIILHSGNARTSSMAALDAMAIFDFASASELLHKAEEDLIKAHRAHSGILQESTNGDIEYSVLFAHAQDTMMMVMSEIESTKKHLEILIALDKRLSNLEKEGKE